MLNSSELDSELVDSKIFDPEEIKKVGNHMYCYDFLIRQAFKRNIAVRDSRNLSRFWKNEQTTLERAGCILNPDPR